MSKKKKSCDNMSSKYTAAKRSITRSFLEGPSKLMEQIECEKASIENLNDMVCCTSSHIFAAPSGSRNFHAHEDLIVKKMELEERLKKDLVRLDDMKAEIILAIMSLDNPDHQDAIRYRFLEGYTNQKTADKMHVEVRTVQRYVEAACLAMKLPDRFYKKKEAMKTADVKADVGVKTATDGRKPGNENGRPAA